MFIVHNLEFGKTKLTASVRSVRLGQRNFAAVGSRLTLLVMIAIELQYFPRLVGCFYSIFIFNSLPMWMTF